MCTRGTDPCFLRATAQRNIELAMKLERHCNFQDPRDIVYMQRARVLYEAALDDLNAAINGPEALDHKDDAARTNTLETMNVVEKSLHRFREMAANYRFQMMRMDDALQIHMRFLDRVVGVGNDNRYGCDCPDLPRGAGKLAGFGVVPAAACKPGPLTKSIRNHGNRTGKHKQHTDDCKEERTMIMKMLCEAYRIELENFYVRSSDASDAGTCGSASDLAQVNVSEDEGEREK